MSTNSIQGTVRDVTVFPDRAQVTLVATSDITPATKTILVDDLPLTLDPDSMRVAGAGSASVRINGLDVQRHHYVETPAEVVRELTAKQQALTDERQALYDQQASLEAQLEYVAGMRGQAEAYARELARGRNSLEEQAKIGRFLLDEDIAVRGQLRGLLGQIRDLDQQIDQVARELQTYQSQKPTQRYRAAVNVDVSTAGNVALELTYTVRRASWQPLYDVTLDINSAEPSLEMVYMAQIRQQTGQDWHNANVRVSTARPALNRNLPELQPWYVDERRVRPQVRKAKARPMMREAAPAMMAADDAAEEAEVMAMVAAPVQHATAQVDDSGFASTFIIAGGTDIPSDGAPHKATIQRFGLPVTVDYLTVPRVADVVYRRAEVTNAQTAPLMAGSGNLYVGSDFIGRIPIPFTAPDETLDLMLGVEDRVRVKRTLQKRSVDKKLLGDRRRTRYGYQIELENLMAQPVKLAVHDQIPVSRHEQIKVKWERVEPNPVERTNLNIVKWELTLAPAAKETIIFEYLVEHPRDMQITIQ